MARMTFALWVDWLSQGPCPATIGSLAGGSRGDLNLDVATLPAVRGIVTRLVRAKFRDLPSSAELAAAA